MCRDFIQILSRHLHICSKIDVPKGPYFYDERIEAKLINLYSIVIKYHSESKSDVEMQFMMIKIDFYQT